MEITSSLTSVAKVESSATLSRRRSFGVSIVSNSRVILRFISYVPEFATSRASSKNYPAAEHQQFCHSNKVATALYDLLWALYTCANVALTESHLQIQTVYRDKPSICGQSL